MIVSITPKSDRLMAVLVAARNTKCMQDFLLTATERFLATEEGVIMENNLLHMNSIKNKFKLEKGE